MKLLATGVVAHEVSEETDLLKAYVKHQPEFTGLLNAWQFQQQVIQHTNLIVLCGI
jgi:hypothetical protein